MNRWTPRLRNLPTATFGGFAPRGRHSRPILAWRISGVQHSAAQDLLMAMAIQAKIDTWWAREMREWQEA